MPGGAWVGFAGHAQGAAKRFEDGFNDVVIINAAQGVDVDGGAGVVGKAVEKFKEGFGVHLTNFVAAEIDVPVQPRSPGEINHYPRKRFIKRHVAESVAGDAFFIAQCFAHGITKGNAGVFHAVVTVNVQIACDLNVEIKQAVALDLIQHVVKKTDAGGEIARTRAVKIDAHGDLGFGGVAGNFSGSGHGSRG